MLMSIKCARQRVGAVNSIVGHVHVAALRCIACCIEINLQLAAHSATATDMGDRCVGVCAHVCVRVWMPCALTRHLPQLRVSREKFQLF